MSSKKASKALLGASCVALLAIQPAQGQETVDLFSPAPGETPRAAFGLPGVAPEAMGPVAYFTLSTAARAAFRAGGPAPRRIRIALPGGDGVTCTFPARFETAGPDGPAVIAGAAAGAGLGEGCTLVGDGAGGIVGHVETADGRYRIVPVGAGGPHAVVRILPAGLKREMEPLRHRGAEDGRGKT